MEETIPEQQRALLGVVETQLKLKGEWRFVRETYERLRSAGVADSEARDLLMKALAAEYYRSIEHPDGFDRARYERDLRRLPLLPWQADATGSPGDVTEEEVTRAIVANPNLRLLSPTEVAERYRVLRPQLTRLQNAIVHLVSREDLEASARRLGVWRQGTLVLDSEDEMAVLVDYTLYADPGVRRRLLGEYLRAHTDPLSDDEWKLLEAMAKARYALMECNRVVAPAGLMVTDLLRGGTFLLADQSAAKTGAPGAILAAHVLCVEGLHMQTGGSVPVPDRAALDALCKALPEEEGSFDDLNKDGRLTGRIIRALLRAQVLGRDAYDAEPAPLAVSRNAPCPCGSGRKYKRCCGSSGRR